ncbi:MAG TPA: hypothetical protein VEJ18_15805 [Planctomycetota bacterium]|nr:hypothetical protein [Planctomycetota bacterium]
MRRAWAILLILGGCAGPSGPAPDAVPDAMEALRRRSNALTAFHYVAEIHDGRTTARVELGYRAPDRAFLRYGPAYAIYLSGGTAHYFTRQGYLRFELAEELAALRKAYGDLPIGGEPTPVFGLQQWENLLHGRGLRTTLGLGVLGWRLGWLPEFARWTPDGEVRRYGPMSVTLGPDGFPVAAQAGETTELRLLSLVVNEALPDDLFEPPSRDGLPEIFGAREDLRRGLDDAFHRWVLEADTSDATLERLARVDLERRYEPAKTVEILRQSLERSLEVWRSERPVVAGDALRARLDVERGRVTGTADAMEQDILGQAERALDRWFRGMAVLPPHEHMQDVAARWRKAHARQVDALFRRPFLQVVDELGRK